jgi:outer membrane protein
METENLTNNNPTPEEIKNKMQDKSCEHKKCRCCLSMILNIISLAGVIVLFVLYFIGHSGSNPAKKSNNSSLYIGFVNSDTVMQNYSLVKTFKDSLEAKQKKAETDFTAQQNIFEAQVAKYQKDLKANTLSIEQAQSTEKTLSQQQESLLALKDELTQKLSDEELSITTMIQDSIINYLKRYNRTHNYDYILGFSKGSGILIANDSLDLTKEVLEGLNKEYKNEK